MEDRTIYCCDCKNRDTLLCPVNLDVVDNDYCSWAEPMEEDDVDKECNSDV